MEQITETTFYPSRMTWNEWNEFLRLTGQRRGKQKRRTQLNELKANGSISIGQYG